MEKDVEKKINDEIEFEDIEIKLLCEEMSELQYINFALRKQINRNESRLAEIDKILAQNLER